MGHLKTILIMPLFLSLFVGLATHVNCVSSDPIYIGGETVDLYPIADSYVNSGGPDSNYGSTSDLVVQFDSVFAYVYVMFDLSSIPSNAMVKDAYVRFYLTDISASGEKIEIGVHRCQDTSWNELSITWNNKPEFAEEATSTHRFGGFPIGFESPGYKGWWVAEDVQASLANGKLTEVLRFEPTEGSGKSKFYSKEGRQKPRLSVEYAVPPFYKVQIESMQDTGETSNLGSIAIEGETCAFLPVEVLAMPGSYEVTYNSGYEFLRWEATGELDITDRRAKQTTFRVSGEGTLKAVGDARKIEYAYEYGEALSFEGDFPKKMFAVKFTPVLPGQLAIARFLVTSVSMPPWCDPSENIITIHVTDSNRKDIIPCFNITFPITLEGEWFDVDLSAYRIGVSPGFDFYIGLEWVADRWLGIGWTYSDVSPSRSWEFSQGKWSQFLTKEKSYLIRAIVKLLPTAEIKIEPQSASIVLGEPISISGSVYPPLMGVELTLTYTKPDGTKLTRTVITMSEGLFKDTYVPDKPGNWSVSASTYETTSSPVSFTVKEKPMPTPTPTEPVVYGLIAAAGILSIILFVRRRKRLVAPPPVAPISAKVPAPKRYCIHCGEGIPEGYIYCDRCGGRQ